MKIVDIKTYVVKPQNKTAYMAGKSKNETLPQSDYFRRPNLEMLFSTKMESILVKITTDEEIVGWGEAQAPLAPEAVQAVVETLLKPCLLGEDPLKPQAHWWTMYKTMRGRGQVSGFMLDAIAACDIALWDIMGKVAGMPIYKLLGGEHRTKLPVYVSGLTEDDIVNKCKRWVEKGFTVLKLKLGFTPEKDIEITRSVREAVGPEVRLALDVHWKYWDYDAIRLGRTLEQLGVFFLESPVPTEEVDGLARVAQSLDLPIASGEEYRTAFEYRDRLVKQAFDIIQPDVGRTGISEFRKICELGETFGCPCAPHIGIGLGVYVAATLQISAAISNFLVVEYQPSLLPLANEVLEEELFCQEGLFYVPDKPGLGITVKEEVVAEWADQ